MDHMSPLDSMFLHVEDGITHMHIGSCAVFEGPAPEYHDVVSLVASKLPLIPRYRQKVRFVPGALGRPVWIDDPHFNLDYHVRHSALPPPGSESDLNALMGRLMSQELDRHRPLWEMWMIEGLPNHQWAIISKVHHCMVDGVSGTDLIASLLDPSRDAPQPALDTWRPAPEPSDAMLVVESLAQLVSNPAEQARAVRSLARTPRRAASQLREGFSGLRSLGRQLMPRQSLSIEGTIGPHRRWSAAHADLADIKAIKKAYGGTVNDVVLAVITGAFRDLLSARLDDPDHAVLRSLVPVSVRPVGDHSANNQVSAMVAELPVGIADPLDRLASMRKQMERLKGSDQAATVEALPALAGLFPPSMLSLGLRTAGAMAREFPQRAINTVTTNVPGPQYPLYAAGRLMTDYLPFVPLAQGVRIGVAIMSYNGNVSFGVTGDYDTVPDLEEFCRSIETGIGDLRDRTRRAGRRKAG
jgi:WS/DGAT/MGAT family acyltransferase